MRESQRQYIAGFLFNKKFIKPHYDENVANQIDILTFSGNIFHNNRLPLEIIKTHFGGIINESQTPCKLELTFEILNQLLREVSGILPDSAEIKITKEIYTMRKLYSSGSLLKYVKDALN